MNNHELIAYYCKELRLGTSIVKNYRSISLISNDEFLAKLLELELKNREVVRKNRARYLGTNKKND